VEKKDKKALLEVYIFAKPWNIEEITKLLDINKEELESLIKEINEELKDRPYFISLDEGYVYFSVKDEFFDYVKDYLKPNLNKDEIEILTMIINNFSYSDIVAKKGKKAKEILKNLEKNGWIKIKKENKKYKFILTKKFKQYFQIK